MQKGPIYYPEYELVEKHQNGEFNWVDYIRHHSEAWCEEYEEFCKEHGYDEDNDDAPVSSWTTKMTNLKTP